MNIRGDRIFSISSPPSRWGHNNANDLVLSSVLLDDVGAAGQWRIAEAAPPSAPGCSESSLIVAAQDKAAQAR
jgi:hypothetical protein